MNFAPLADLQKSFPQSSSFFRWSEGLSVASPLNQALVNTIHFERGYFTFYLNEALLLSILQSRDRQESLHIPPRLISTLQRTVFLDLSQELRPPTPNLPQPVKETNTRLSKLRLELPLQSGLTFLSYYEGKPVLQTLLQLDGTIRFQVCREILQNDRGVAIAKAHNWLIDQLFHRLQRQTTAELLLLSWLIACLPTAVTLTHSFVTTGQLSTRVIAPLITTVLIPWLRDRARARLITLLPRLRSWLLIQSFAPQGWIGKLARKLLGRFS